LVTDVRFLLGLHHSLKKRVSNRERQLYVYQFAFDGKLGRSRYLGYNFTSKGRSHDLTYEYMKVDLVKGEREYKIGQNIQVVTKNNEDYCIKPCGLIAIDIFSL
ncbi:unnamed protein product, partial [Timema podura]|nr:unnamed protein product [Timema podura]